jgi:hypothetical protein
VATPEFAAQPARTNVHAATNAIRMCFPPVHDANLIQVVAVKLVWFCPAGKMQSISLPPSYEPVGRGDESLVFSTWLFALIPLYRLKGADSIIVPVASDDLAIRSANGSANN